MRTINDLICQADRLISSTENLSNEIKEISERATMYLRRNEEIHMKFRGIEYLEAVSELHDLVEKDKRRSIEIFSIIENNVRKIEEIKMTIKFLSAVCDN